MKKALTIMLLLVLSSGLLFAAGQQEGTVRVAAQKVNETILLAHMAKILIEENTDLSATVNTEFNGSSVLHQAMVGGEIDIYPTWTGTQLTGILRYDGPNLPSAEAYQRVKAGFEERFDFTWSEPMGFNNTYIMVVRRDVAEELGLERGYAARHIAIVKTM